MPMAGNQRLIGAIAYFSQSTRSLQFVQSLPDSCNFRQYATSDLKTSTVANASGPTAALCRGANSCNYCAACFIMQLSPICADCTIIGRFCMIVARCAHMCNAGFLGQLESEPTKFVNSAMYKSTSISPVKRAG